MDIGRIILAIIVIAYCTYKLTKNNLTKGRKKLHVFWILLFAYSITSFGFIIRPENYTEIMSMQSYGAVRFLNATLIISAALLGVNILFESFRKKRIA